MPLRLPTTRTTELATYGVAGVVGFAPFYFILPGTEERLAHQTARWAPRWERNISYFAPPAQRIAQRIEPRLERTVKKIEHTLPLEKAAKGMSRRIIYGFDKMGIR
ncbi:hypothetical protein F4779DRAFT_187223 [Xylariaceae sp. FL0662B]|nr:hypothetical protein F4779DRAFT_187223 [Xylariaceae sp. FL0662B]